MDRQRIAELVARGQWFHSFEIVPGVTTPGRVHVDARATLDHYGVPHDLQGRRALDIGTWDGAYAFELERRGAEVVAADIQDPSETGFEIASSILGSSVRYVRQGVLELSVNDLEPFDVVLFFGVYYHLKSPLAAFERLRPLLKEDGRLFFEGAVLDWAGNVDAGLAARVGKFAAVLDEPIAYFVADTYAGDNSNWHLPTRVCLRDWLRTAGFEIEWMTDNRRDSRCAGRARVARQSDLPEHGLVSSGNRDLHRQLNEQSGRG